jgi:hypothetical protein
MEGSKKMSPLLVASVGFALFILCPRMAGMANVIAKATNSNLVLVAIRASSPRSGGGGENAKTSLKLMTTSKWWDALMYIVRKSC